MVYIRGGARGRRLADKVSRRCQPYAGGFFFTLSGQTGTNASFRQHGVSALTAGSLLRLTGRISTEQNTDNDVRVATGRLLDAEGGVLTESSTDPLATASNVWGEFSITLWPPQKGCRLGGGA